ncbi:MAG: hypothetical protein ACREBA_00600 [Nitrosotalea sp.]
MITILAMQPQQQSQCVEGMLPNGTCAEPGLIFNTYDLSEKDCGQFYTVPNDNHYFETYPVLILKQNSIGCAKLTFTINYKYNDNRSSSPWPQMALLGDTFHIGKYIYTSNGNTFGVSSRDAIGFFETRSIPNAIDLSKYQVGSL